MMTSIVPWISTTIPRKAHFAVGACPFCGRLDTSLNNVPLTAYCDGGDINPHPDWEKVVPEPHNPYLEGYEFTAPVVTFEFNDRRFDNLKEFL